jgi:hypothetical protein
MKKENIGGVPGNVLGMLADLNLKLQHGRITPKQLERFLKKQNPFENVANGIISEWESFYADLGIKCDLGGIRIPADPGGFLRVIIVAKGITPQSAYDLCSQNFKCWKWTSDNLDKIVTSERTAQNGHYAIRIRDRVEADEELKGLSYNQLKAQNFVGITLEERLIYELKYFKETSKHLDIHNWTRCDGSLYHVGCVPYVGWDGLDDEMSVFRYHPDLASDGLRARVAVV